MMLIFSEGTPWKKEREEAGNGLPLFPVSGSRIPKIPDFCEKRNENPQTRFAQTEWISVLRYGATSESELFAEAFAEYFGGQNPREFAKIFGRKLDALLKGVK